MRFVLAAALVLVLGACERLPDEAPRATPQSACTHHASHELSWTSESAPDVVTASSEGPTCGQAIVTLTIRNASGDPLWTMATTYYDMSIGGRGPEEPPAVSEADMQAFLDRWSNVAINHTSDLPEWREGAAQPAAADSTISYNTAFDRETYETLRARNLPQACLAVATAATQCLVIDPMTNSPAVIVAFGE